MGIAVGERVSPELDWKKFLRIVKRHRIGGLVYRALTKLPSVAGVPVNVQEALSLEATRIATHNLRLAAEAVRIDRLMAQSNINAAFLKGTALAKLAYNDIGVRHSKDVDLLIPPQSLEVAMGVLTDAGYRVSHPRGLRPSHLPWLKRVNHHIALVHPVRRTEVELHWRVTRNPRMLPDLPAPESWIAVEIAHGTALRTFPVHDLILYLCAHGAGHCWFRMKWLVDIALLIAPMRESELRALLRHAADVGMIRPLAQALLLASSILALPLPPVLVKELDDGRAVRLLVKAAATAMYRIDEPYDVPFGTASMSLTQYLLRADWHYIREQLIVHLGNQDDWHTVRLPPSLMFLYPLLRVPLWVGRQLKASAHDQTVRE